MKPKLLSIIFSLLFMSTLTYGQDEMFKVLASKGANKFVAASSTEQKPVLIGKKLFKDDKIVVGENSYLGLAHKSGKTIELKKPGTYEVSKLSSEVASQNAGVAKKYVDFVAGEMASSDEDMAKNRLKYMAVTGSVERGTEDGIKKIAPPKEAYVLSTSVMLKWIPVDSTSTTTYLVTLTDLSDEPIYSVETKEKFVIVDLNKLNIKTEKTFLWRVTDKKSKTSLSNVDATAIKYAAEDKAAELEKQSTEMRKELSDETALNKFVLASFYEEKGLLLDALTNYEAAIKLEPSVDVYQAMYAMFLEKNKLVSAK